MSSGATCARPRLIVVGGVGLEGAEGREGG